jgi:hypothetical protein
MNLAEIKCDVVDGIHLAGSNKHVNERSGFIEAYNISTSWATISFSPNKFREEMNSDPATSQPNHVLRTL